MSRVIVVFFLVLLIIQCTNAVFPQSWNDPAWRANNTNIFYSNGKEVWFPGIFNIPLSSLRLDELQSVTTDSRFGTLLARVIEKRTSAYDAGVRCTDSYLEMENAKAISTTNALILGALFGSPNGFGGIIIGTLTHVALTSIQDTLFTLLSYNPKSTALVTTCSDYGAKWRIAMSAAVDLLDFSTRSLYEEWQEALASYDKLRESGVCDDDYYYGGRETCDYIEGKLTLQNEQFSSMVGSKGVALSSLNFQLRTGLGENIPNTTAYYEYVEFIWGRNGSIFEAQYVDTLSRTTIRSVENDTRQLFTLLEEKELVYKNKILDIEKEEPSKITSVRALYGVVASEKQESIADSYERLKREYGTAQETNDAARSAFHVKEKGYLKNAITDAKESLRIYETMESTLALLHEDMELVVDDKKSEALTAINSFDTLSKHAFVHDAAKLEYSSAKNAFVNGESASSLGEAFQYYEAAAYHARFAKNLFENKPLGNISEIKGRKESLRSLIMRAQVDGIDVTYEKEEFSLLEKSEEPWILDSITEIESRIIAKADTLYLPLYEKRRILLDDIERGNEATADLKTSLSNAEGTIFDENGKVRYPTAIGSLNKLQTMYAEIEGELEKERDSIVLNSLSKDSVVFIDPVSLDTPTRISIDFVVRNPTGYLTTDGEVSFLLPYSFEFLVSDIGEGKDAIKELFSNNRKVTLLFKEIKPYTTYRVQLGKELILARTTKKTVSSVGKSDGSASVTQDVQFDLNLDSSLSTDALEVDGLPYYGQKLRSGKHTLLTKSTVFDAFTIETDNFEASKIGLTTTMRYEYVVTPLIDLDSASIQASINPDVLHLDVVSLSGDQIKNIKHLSSGLLLFDVLTLKVGEESRILIQYSIANASGEIANDILFLQTLQLSSEESADLQHAQDRFRNNDTEGALETIEKIKHSVELREVQENKLLQKHTMLYDAAEKQLLTLTLLYEDYKDALDSPFVDRLASWISKLKTTLADTSAITPDSVSKLESLDLDFDKKLSKDIRNEVVANYNSLKKELLELNNAYEKPLSFTDLERALQSVQDGNLNDYFVLLEQLADAKESLEEKKTVHDAERAKLKSTFTILKTGMLEQLKTYKKYAQSAAGSPFLYLFTVEYKDVEKEIKNIDTLFEKSAPLEEVIDHIKTAESMSTQLSTTIKAIEDEASKRVLALERSLLESEARKEEKDKIAKRISRMKELLANKEYINALKVSETLIKDISTLKKSDDQSLTVLSITALFIVGVCIAYFVKSSKRKKEETGLKRLKKISD